MLEHWKYRVHKSDRLKCRVHRSDGNQGVTDFMEGEEANTSIWGRAFQSLGIWLK